jgi:NADH-quinone oxidoreductase subunit G
MCVVKIEKMPKLQTACTTVVSEGMIVATDSDEMRQARKAMVELLLGNHPLDCPVCDAGGECELQDMAFSYGASESKYIEAKNHKEEQQWSPVVFFDRPRCILCYRCVRVCGEGMDVWALGVQNRGVSSIIAPNEQDHLDCEECGMCIDICPVGALTSGRVSLQDASVGNEPCGHDLHPLRGRVQDYTGRAALRHGHGNRPRRQSRQERHQ